MVGVGACDCHLVWRCRTGAEGSFLSEKIKYYPKRVTSFYHFYQDIFQEFFVREFLGVLVVGILDFYCCDPVSVPSWVTEILQAVWHREKKKRVFC